MIIEKLIIENLNSFEGMVEIDFSKFENSLFLITGPTGSGKTTILDAISLALYGETPRINKNDSKEKLINSEKNEAKSTLYFKLYDEEYKAEWSIKSGKGAKKNLLKKVKDKYNVSDKKIEELLSLDFKQFSKTIMLAQGAFDAFLKGNDKEKYQILSKIFNGEDYRKISQKIYEEFQTITSNLKTKEKEKEKIEDELNEYKNIDSEIKNKENEKSKLETKLELAKIIEEKKDKKNKLTQIEQEIANIDKELKESNYEKYEKLHDNLQTIINLKNEIENLKNTEKEYENIKNEIENLKSKINNQNIDEKEIRKAKLHEEYGDLLKEGEPCPLCGNIVHNLEKTSLSSKKMEETLKNIKELEKLKNKLSSFNTDNFQKIKEHIKELKNYGIDYNNIDNELEQIKNFPKLSTKKGKLVSLKENKQELEKVIKEIVNKIQQINIDLKEEENIKTIQKSIETINKELGRLEEKKAQKNKLENNKKKINEDIKNLIKEHELLKILNEKFGSKDGDKLEKIVISYMLDTLLKITNEKLQNLTDGRYLISKKEFSKNAFEFEIIDTYYGNEKRAINTLSGGETFLVSLSLALGFSDLISTQKHIGVMFLDEGFGTLDESTLSKTLDMLMQIQNEKMIGIISHVNTLKEIIPKKIVISKNQGKSKIKIEAD